MDAPTHLLGQFSRNGQTQPSPTMTPRQTAINLAKLIEDERQGVRRDSNPCVTNDDIHPAGGGDCSRDAYGTLISEFHRVADQVEQYLAQSLGIANDAWQRRREVDLQRERLGRRLRGDILPYMLDNLHQVDRFHRELESARLHP